MSAARPAMFVVKATISPEQEAAFNAWYDGVRSAEAARVPGCTGMRKRSRPSSGRTRYGP